MKKLNFGQFDSIKVESLFLNKIVGGSDSVGGTWTNPESNPPCGAVISFTYTSDTISASGGITYNGSAGTQKRNEC